MSTSLAIQPAYPGSKADRTKANPDRTIFGTTLDNYGRCWKLLNDQEVQACSDQFYFEKLGKKWTPKSARSQRVYNSGWGLQDFSKPEIAEEFVRDYDIDNHRGLYSSYGDRLPFITTPALSHHRGVSAPGTGPAQSRGKKRTMSAPEKKRRPVYKVPRFRLPPNTYNPMRMSSLKITETGAKDLINARKVNEIGLAGTLQYNHEANQRHFEPMFYKNHGSALSLGQYFSDATTNKDVTAPGGFYKLSTADRERFKAVEKADYRPSEATIVRKPRREFVPDKLATQQDWKITPSEIPLNIRHKFGESNIKRLLHENQNEVSAALQQDEDLTHSGMVPARKLVKELNHPVDPPTKYFSNFGGNLKYDKFEGGLHLYIK